jgi:energy-coupling factor transport system permease protein
MDSSSRLIIGQYFPGNSFLHTAHPVLKLVLLFFYCTLVFQVGSLQQFILLLPIILLLANLAGASPALMFRGLRPLLFLLIITFLIHLLTTPGESIIEIGSFQGSYAGLQRGAFYCLRLILVVLGSSLLTITTSSVQITYALDRILKPLIKLGFPAQEFSLMIAISLRFIPVLLEEYEKLILAQTARGARFDSKHPMKRIDAYTSILIPMFQRVFERADNLAIAMEVRGFNPDRERTSIHSYGIGISDIRLLLVFVSTTGLVILSGT